MSSTDAMTAAQREDRVLERIDKFRQRRPRLLDDVVTLAHGAGGKSSAALVDAVFLEAFRNSELEQLGDAAILSTPSGERLAFSTDSYVVQPLRFPGGSIGQVAVHGTINDLAVSGARPEWLSAGFVIEEGFPISDLREIVADMSEAAASAGVQIVTGDTKVVGRGAADGMYICTTGVGVIPEGRRLARDQVQAGDKVLLSGTIGEHGMAVMLARGDLAIDADITSDTAPVNALVEALLGAAPSTRWMRDATRGGVGTVCNELAKDAPFAVILDEDKLPVEPQVLGACDMLGIDPLYVANEGKFVAIVAPDEADAGVAALRAHPRGGRATVVGEIVPEPPGIVALRTSFGGSRIVRHACRRPASTNLLKSQGGDDVFGDPRSGGRHRRRRSPSGQG
ncbi:hydrogenase expression/formation protein HypE [Mycobacterium lentiflavum]|uniref:Hydrogenase expression/formation protein HypE n=1 Tax=Mycobacterium lentiflavum TaxID=141349 RepID=A0A0E3WE50_MYCLN|nr:hydrogenase expression/formation protein HypE [Mycobacterium lentiflavum]